MSKILIIGANSASGKALYDFAGNTNDDFYFCDLSAENIKTCTRSELLEEIG